MPVTLRDSGPPGCPRFPGRGVHEAPWSVRQLAAALHLAAVRDPLPLPWCVFLLALVALPCVGWMESYPSSAQCCAWHVEVSGNICLMSESQERAVPRGLRSPSPPPRVVVLAVLRPAKACVPSIPTPRQVALPLAGAAPVTWERTSRGSIVSIIHCLCRTGCEN